MSKPTRAAVFIRDARKRAGLTQREVAERLGVTAAAVCNYENGASFPSAEMAFALCKILNVTPREQFECEGEE